MLTFLATYWFIFLLLTFAAIGFTTWKQLSFIKALFSLDLEKAWEFLQGKELAYFLVGSLSSLLFGIFTIIGLVNAIFG